MKTTAAINPRRAEWLGYSLVILAGACWACLGIFFRWLERYDVPSTLIALDRAALAGMTLLGFALARGKHTRWLQIRDLPLFLIYGAGIASFFLVYIEAVDAGSVALASVLLYTAPVWIAIMAWWRWKEPFTQTKVMALVLAIIGSALVAIGSDRVVGNSWAIILGLISGFSYGLYSIFSNEGLQRGYRPSDIVMYSMLIAALCLIPFQDWNAFGRVVQTPGAWIPLLGVAFVSTLLAPVCYVAGQQRVGASIAGILATVEPVLAALMAWILLQETLAPTQLIGGACVLMAVIILARRTPSSRKEPYEQR